MFFTNNALSLKGKCLAGKTLKYNEVTEVQCKLYLHYIVMYYCLYIIYSNNTSTYRVHDASVSLCSVILSTLLCHYGVL